MSIPTFGDGRPAPTPEEIDWQHQRAGRGRDRVHHFLGLDADDASPGNHTHDGKNSLRVARDDIDDIDGTLLTLTLTIGDISVSPLAHLLGNRVYLSGRINNGSGLALSNVLQTILTLPSGYRPTAQRAFIVAGNGATVLKIVAQTTGNIDVQIVTGSPTQVYLDGVDFRVG